MKKIISVFIVFILVLAGCGSATPTEAGDDVLTIWGFFEGAPKTALDYYGEQTGTEVEYTSIGWGDYQTKLNTVLGTNDAPDIVLLERGFMGSYLTSDNFLYIEDIMGDDENMEAYKENTAKATSYPGMIDDKVKAIGWENTASAFFYRSDLASKCLDINSVEEMEAATQTLTDYETLQQELKDSSDPTCSKMSLLSYPAYATGLFQQIGLYNIQDDGTYVIPKDFSKVLDKVKDLNENGFVYSPQSDKTQMITGAKSDAFLGAISLAWATQDIEDYEQPGQWAIADTPLDFTAGGSYMAVTTNADQDLVKEFLDMTFLNEDWLVDNMEQFGMVGNEKVMDKYLEEADGSNDYFGGENTVKKFSEINSNIDLYFPVTKYDSGLGTSIDEVVAGYTVDKSIATTEDAANQLKSKLNSLYPELEVTIEE